jgi:LacI family transcriptional regulator
MPQQLRKKSSERTGRAGVLDVALRAGVSIATVSRVINGAAQVKPETRGRVEAAAQELDYAPNSFARSLALNSSRTLGVVVPSLRGSIFASAVEAMQRQAETGGYSILLACSDYCIDRELDLARKLVARGVDGLVLVGIDHHDDLRPMLLRRGIPYVCHGAIRSRAPHPAVGFDNAEVMASVTRYLVGLGHRRFAVIAGVSEANDRVRDRIAGIRGVLGEHGIPLNPAMLVEARYELAAACDAMSTILSRGRPPTAVICINDVLAHGAILACQAHALDVPRDISVTGFDDLEFAAHVRPSITTMRVPTDVMGAAAVRELLARVAGKRGRHSIPVPTELVVRNSTAAPPKAYKKDRQTGSQVTTSA